MKTKIILLIILITGIISCKKDVVETPAPATPPLVYADSVDGTYNGMNLYHHFWLATGDNGVDTSYTNIVVRIDSSASNQIIINSDTFTLDSANNFNTIHPSSDFHIFNGGSFILNSSGGASISWSHGSASMSGSHYYTFTGTR